MSYWGVGILLIKHSLNSVLTAFCLALLMATTSVIADEDESIEAAVQHEPAVYQFKNEVDRARYYSLIAELRCPKCQNQSLSDSDAVSAEVLREQVYMMIQDNRSDQEIVMFMVERFGEFVLYRPAFSSSNAILWGAPALFLLIALFVLFARMSRRKVADAPMQPSNSSMNVDEQVEARLKRMRVDNEQDTHQ